MPNKTINELRKKIEGIDVKLENHLVESGSIKADLAWIKQIMWLGIAAGGTATAGVLVQLFLMITRK